MLIRNIYKLLFVFIIVIIFPVEASYKITVHDSSKAYQGTTIFADTSSSPHKIVEVDMDGNIVWEYRVPSSLYKGKHGKRNGLNDVELLNNGNILFNIQLVGAYEINRVGEIQWQHMDNQMSHDVDRLENGNTLYTQGWVDHGGIHAVEVNSNGDEVWSWDGMDIYDRKPFTKVNHQGWFHANGITRMKNGNTLISLRNLNRIVEVDENGQMVQEKVFGKKGKGSLKKKNGVAQHDPEVLSDGNILVPLTKVNKVIELNADRKKVWEWQDPAGKKAKLGIRDANRLPNGNTLIVQYNKIIEITKEGGTVWELVIPGILYSKKGINKFLYKAIRIQ